MTLGALTLVEEADAVGAVWLYRCNLVGDGAYPAGGSTGLLGKLQVLTKKEHLDIVGVVDQSIPSTLSALEYDHANEKLFARVRSTGVESAVGDQSAVTYQLLIWAK